MLTRELPDFYRRMVDEVFQARDNVLGSRGPLRCLTFNDGCGKSADIYIGAIST